MSARENLGRLSLLELLRQLTVPPSEESKMPPKRRPSTPPGRKKREPFETFDDATATDPGF
jgi:hypothetical protein